jgi:hypothetical protein
MSYLAFFNFEQSRSPYGSSINLAPPAESSPQAIGKAGSDYPPLPKRRFSAEAAKLLKSRQAAAGIANIANI